MLFIATTLLLSGCLVLPYPSSSDPVPVNPPGIPTSGLLLDDLSFPPGWKAVNCEPYCDLSLKESSRTFGREGMPGRVVQDVFYYRTERNAEAKFQRYLETTGHSYPSEINYLSPIADEQYLRCGIVERNDIKICQAARRYGNYFVYLYFDIDMGYDDGLPTIEDVEPILRALDERVSERLDIPFPAEEENPSD